MYFDPLYMVLIAVGTGLSMLASFMVQGTFSKYAQIDSSLGLTGAEVAERILQRMGVTNVTIEHIGGELTDHYDPGAKAVRLSDTVYGSRSLAAAAVAAHECGHVLQDVKGYKFMNLRSAIFPVTQFASPLAPWIIMGGGLLMGASQFLGLFVVKIGIAMFASIVLFHVVTLPVEFNASSRALKIIDELGILQGEENRGARKVLNAAAFTYVAAAIAAALQLLYFVMRYMGSDRR